jgi:hypothetical protein
MFIVWHPKFKKTTFQKLDLFPSSGERREIPTLLGPLKIANDPCHNNIYINTQHLSPSPHLKRETDPVSETLCILVFRIPDDGQIPETQ